MVQPVPQMRVLQTLVEGRSCGSCSLCCILPEIDAFDKPANQPCRHCVTGGGCSAYAERPATCRDFFCLWRTDESLPEEWAPQRCGMMLYHQGPQLTVLVDPAFGNVWEEERYRAELTRRAGELEAAGGYLVIFRGDAVSVIKAE